MLGCEVWGFRLLEHTQHTLFAAQAYVAFDREGENGEL